MLSKNNLKLIKSLHIKKFRSELELFLVEGRKSVMELLASDFEIEQLICTETFFEDNKSQCKNLQNVSINSAEEIAALGNYESNNAAIAIAKMIKREAFEMMNDELVLCVDGIQDPGNLGTIIRTADWFGVKHLICSPQTVDLYNPKVIAATMGSFTRVKIKYTELEKELKTLQINGLSLIGAMLDGNPLTEIKPMKGVLIIGSEAHGISNQIKKIIDIKVKIPALGKAESLNAAVATGILLHHFSK
jgi:RNA methyltransferase, TrmH family